MFDKTLVKALAIHGVVHRNRDPDFLAQVFELLEKKREPRMMLEIFFFCQQNDMRLDPRLFQSMFEFLNSFSNLQRENLNLLLSYFSEDEVFPDFHLLETLFFNLGKTMGEDEFETNYNRVKTAVELKAFRYRVELSNDENTQLEEQFTTEREILLKKLASLILSVATKRNFLRLADMLFVEMKFNDYFSNQDDVLSLLCIGVHKPEMMNEILNDMIPRILYPPDEDETPETPDTPEPPKRKISAVVFSPEFHDHVFQIVTSLPPRLKSKMSKLYYDFLQNSHVAGYDEMIRLMLIEYSLGEKYSQLIRYLGSLVRNKGVTLSLTNVRLVVKMVHECPVFQQKLELKKLVNRLSLEPVFELKKEDYEDESRQEVQYDFKEEWLYPSFLDPKMREVSFRKSKKKKSLKKKIFEKFIRINYAKNPYDEEIPDEI